MPPQVNMLFTALCNMIVFIQSGWSPKQCYAMPCEWLSEWSLLWAYYVLKKKKYSFSLQLKMRVVLTKKMEHLSFWIYSLKQWIKFYVMWKMSLVERVMIRSHSSLNSTELFLFTGQLPHSDPPCFQVQQAAIFREKALIMWLYTTCQQLLVNIASIKLNMFFLWRWWGSKQSKRLLYNDYRKLKPSWKIRKV